MRALIAFSNKEQTATYTTNLTTQQAELDILAKRLRVAAGVDSEDVTENSSRINENKRRSFSYMQMRVQATERIIYTKINIVRDAGRQPGANTVLSKVLGYIRLLDEVQQALDKDVDVVSNQLVTADLTETQATKLSERIKTLVDTATIDVATLHAKLI